MVDPKLWACRFIQHPAAFPPENPFVLLGDARCDPGAAALLRAIGGDRFAGEVAAAAATPAGHDLVISSRDWPQLAVTALAALPPERILVLLHLDHDPHGYWDFALGGPGGPGLGSALPALLGGKLADAASFAAAARHADHWMASRTARGRMRAGAHHHMVDYAPVVRANADRLVRILAGLADQKSRDAFTRILFGTPEQVLEGYVGAVFGPQQYMEIVRLRPGDTIINGGVETGWELPYFITLLRGEGRIHSFDPIFQIAGCWPEPAVETFAAMLSNHEMALVESDRTIRLAVAPAFGTAHTGSAHLRDEAQAGHAFTDYPGRAIDSLVDDGTVGPFQFVKLDVEGGELGALRGMARSLKRFRPKLAVAIYHEPEHFFDIPAYLMDLLEDYRFYIRHYSCGRFETLLYAVPDEDQDSRSGEESGPWIAPATPGPTAPPIMVTVHMQDDPPRTTHRGGVQQLDRIHGGAWATARLSVAARCDGLEAVAVTEADDRGNAWLVATLPAAPGRDSVVIGSLANRPAVTWLASREVAAGSCIPLVGFDPATAIVAEHGAGEDALYIYRLKEALTEGVTTIRALGMTPFALHPGDAPGRVRVVGLTAGMLHVVDMVLDGGGDRRTVCSMALEDAAFGAVCVATDHRDAKAPRRYGYLLVEAGGEGVALHAPGEGGAFSRLRTLDWPLDRLVSTGATNALPVHWR